MTQNRRFLTTFGVIALCAIVFAQDDSAKGNLLVATRQGDAAVVSTLLKAGVDPNTRDGIGATALMHAAAFGSLETLRVLLDGAADVNASSNGGGTALIWATADPAKVRLLLDRGADARASTTDGTTALVAATRRGNLDVMRLLIARGADPKAMRRRGPSCCGSPTASMRKRVISSRAQVWTSRALRQGPRVLRGIPYRIRLRSRRC